ncbi:SDR family NAD(P)-dependent oxidoreductase [Halobacillus campisalis]|uniref:SDR family NAD(P)-dependent oxidoreductase n=1 Tax=Halobacillus campisalis TaxID=435909 RepID=A0ABW2K3Z8_9BACI|nr:SDR family oxidoreductase [Halobacillus campisalis]
MKSLSGKKILVTGASNGLGMYLAIHIAMRGGEPILAARSSERLKKLAEVIKVKFGGEVHWYCADLSRDEEWKSILMKIRDEQGPVDAVINNAGVGRFSEVAESNWEDIENMLSVNVTSVFRTTHHVLPELLQHGKGHIVNIASQAGKMATPKSAVYSASKHAVLGFSNALRMEVKNQGVYVTSVNLGPVKTNFFTQADPSGAYQKAVERFMLDPNKVAHKIADSLFTPCREINLPAWMNTGSKLYQLVPSAMEKLLESQFRKK